MEEHCESVSLSNQSRKDNSRLWERAKLYFKRIGPRLKRNSIIVEEAKPVLENVNV